MKKEIVLSTYCCHPGGLANNETSGMVVLVEIVKWWRSKQRNHDLRVVIAPETIGALVYLSRDGALEHLRVNVRAGFVLTCLGGPGRFCLQLPRRDNYARRIAENVMGSKYDIEIRPWERRGSDERQWCAPGVDLPFVTVMKTPPGDPRYRQYHTSADDLTYVTEAQLQESFELMRSILEAIEADRRYMVTTIGEPQMSKRGLMPTLSRTGSTNGCRNLMTTLSHCDGASVLENALTQGRPFEDVRAEIEVLREHGLVREET